VSKKNVFFFSAYSKLTESIMNRSRSILIGLADFSLFFVRYFKELIKPPYELNEFLKQSFIIGNQSLALVGITGFIMGLVLTIQTRPTLADFGAESWLPAMISVSIVREIGPVITALICAGKVGSGIGAELASMRVTEQIDAMEVSGSNPFKFIVVSRTTAAMIMIPILTIYSDAISMFGSFVGVNIKGDVNFRLFFSQAFAQLSFTDLIPAIIKTTLFGLVIGLISCYKGYYSDKGTEGVGQASNSSVVISSLLIFIIDILAVQVSNFIIE